MHADALTCAHAPVGPATLVELHCHIEGALTPEFLASQLQKHGGDPALGNTFWRSSDGFRWSESRAWLRTMQAITAQCLRCPDDYEALFDQYFAGLAAGGVRYAEPSLALDRCAMSGMDLEQVLLGAERAMATAAGHRGVQSGLLIALDYRMSIDDCYAHIDMARGTLQERFVGIDLQGLPSCPRSRFAEVFEYARACGLGTRAHVGEFEGARSVWEAVDTLGVDRIAHGVRAVTDEPLMRRLAHDRIPLDMSIGSNVCLGIVDAWERHPIRRFMEQGIPVSLSTDDPLFFSVTPAMEYRQAMRCLGLSMAEVSCMNRDAMKNSFASATCKAAFAPDMCLPAAQGAV